VTRVVERRRDSLYHLEPGAKCVLIRDQYYLSIKEFIYRRGLGKAVSNLAANYWSHCCWSMIAILPTFLCVNL
jgi:hypothetical protein